MKKGSIIRIVPNEKHCAEIKAFYEKDLIIYRVLKDSLGNELFAFREIKDVLFSIEDIRAAYNVRWSFLSFEENRETGLQIITKTVTGNVVSKRKKRRNKGKRLC